MTNIHITPTVRKQLIGAFIGIGAAAFLYVAMNQASNLRIRGLLVSQDTVSENVGGVVTNVVDPDPETLIRLARQARNVATQLQLSESSQVPSSVNAIATRADERGDERAAAIVAAEARANAPVYEVTNPNQVLSETERLAIRNAGLTRAAAGPAPSSAPKLLAGIPGYTPPAQIIQRVEVPVDREVIREVIKEVPVDREVIKEVPVDREVIKEVIREVPVDREVIKEVPVIKEVIREVPVIKEVIREVPVYTNSSLAVKGPLTDSGPGLVLVLGSSALVAFGTLRRKKSAL